MANADRKALEAQRPPLRQKRPWPPPALDYRFEVGDVVWWHIPTVMDNCIRWSPDVTKPVTIIAVREATKSSAQAQMVRVSPNYCPWGDEFNGAWFLPVGVLSHNDPNYCNRPDVRAYLRWKYAYD